MARVQKSHYVINTRLCTCVPVQTTKEWTKVKYLNANGNKYKWVISWFQVLHSLNLLNTIVVKMANREQNSSELCIIENDFSLWYYLWIDLQLIDLLPVRTLKTFVCRYFCLLRNYCGWVFDRLKKQQLVTN